MTNENTCRVEGCDKPASPKIKVQTLCSKHLNRYYTVGQAEDYDPVPTGYSPGVSEERVAELRAIFLEGGDSGLLAHILKGEPNEAGMLLASYLYAGSR